MVQGVEDLRTPLSEIMDLDKELRGTLSGFMMPAFVIDLPGGGGKRLVGTRESYDPATGASTYKTPGLPGKKGEMTYTYHDPAPVQPEVLEEFRQHQDHALQRGETLEEFIAAFGSGTMPLAAQGAPRKHKQQERKLPPPVLDVLQPSSTKSHDFESARAY